jgi:hypothetical protein
VEPAFTIAGHLQVLNPTRGGYQITGVGAVAIAFALGVLFSVLGSRVLAILLFLQWMSALAQAILDIRDQPPENLGRVPGPKAILSYLPRRAELIQAGLSLPRSTRTIWKVLRRNDRLPQERQRKKKPQERAFPSGGNPD